MTDTAAVSQSPWPLPEHVSGALIALFGTVFTVLWGWGIKERRRQSNIMSSNVEAMIRGYQGLIADLAKSVELTRAEISRTRETMQAQCESQLIDLEMHLMRDMRDIQEEYLKKIRELENKNGESNDEC